MTQWWWTFKSSSEPPPVSPFLCQNCQSWNEFQHLWEEKDEEVARKDFKKLQRNTRSTTYDTSERSHRRLWCGTRRHFQDLDLHWLLLPGQQCPLHSDKVALYWKRKKKPSIKFCQLIKASSSRGCHTLALTAVLNRKNRSSKVPLDGRHHRAFSEQQSTRDSQPLREDSLFLLMKPTSLD